MKLEEAKEIVKLLTTVYPKEYGVGGSEIIKSRIKVVYKVFEKYPYSATEQAIMEFISKDTKGFAPPLGLIRERVEELTRVRYKIEEREVDGEIVCFRIPIPSKWE